MTNFKIKPQGMIGKIADYGMMPLMYILQLNLSEVPQRTHYWNNVKLPLEAISHFHHDLMFTAEADANASKRWWGPIPLFHIPFLGGWDQFIVIEPVDVQDEWYVGWIPFDTLGISRIPLKGPVRLLKGPQQATFFGVDKQGNQIEVRCIGGGVLGKSGLFTKIPLL